MELGICCVHLHKGAASFKYRNQHIFEHGYHKYINGQQDVYAGHFHHWCESLLIVNSFLLQKTPGNKPSFKLVNFTCASVFDPIYPLGTNGFVVIQQFH